MVNLKILKSFGSTTERFREVLTSTGEEENPQKGESKEEKSERLKRNTQRKRDLQFRKKFENLLQSRIINGIEYSLKNHRPYAAVDLAWDSIVLSKINMPLLLYAQGKIDVQRAANLLKKLPNGEDFITFEEETLANGEKKRVRPKSINLPKFIDSEVNMIRSMINRRWAAQKNKYANLWPHYNYESRSTGLAGKCRADVMSQRADIMVDQFGTRHHDGQVMLGGFMYGHQVDFVRSSWEIERQYRYKQGSEELDSYISKEGVGWFSPHPSRLFWDLSHPLMSLNSDSGCEYVGFWDVVKYGSIENDPAYFNKDKITFGSRLWDAGGLYGQYLDYFNQYNYAINVPGVPNGSGGTSIDVSGLNDAKNQIGFYSVTNRDSSMFTTNFFCKMVPKEWGVGEYPYPVWARIVAASDQVPIYAEFLPSRPGAVLSINENDGRAVSISMAMEVMQFQQQMSNLLTHFMQLIQVEAFKAIGINTDALDADQVEKIEKILQADDWYSNPLVYRYSLSKKLEQLGIAPSKAMTDVITISEARQGQSINLVFESMVKLITLAERMNAMSAAESGQSEPREISATQTNVIANTTQTVYSSISDCIDDWREAKKVIIYESTVSCHEGVIECPVKNRYTKKTIIDAGFTVKAGEDEDYSGDAKRMTVIGSAKDLVHNYIFSSRDGSERAVNTQAANTLTQLIGYTLAVPEIAKALGREKLYMMFNEVFRMSGGGIDLNLEVEEGSGDSLGEDEISQLKQAIEQIGQMMQQMAQQTQKNASDIAGQAQVNAEQQQHIDLNAKLAEQVLSIQSQVQEIINDRNSKIEPPEIKYADAPPVIQAQIERMHGFDPASEKDRLKLNGKTKPATA